MYRFTLFIAAVALLVASVHAQKVLTLSTTRGSRPAIVFATKDLVPENFTKHADGRLILDPSARTARESLLKNRPQLNYAAMRLSRLFLDEETFLVPIQVTNSRKVLLGIDHDERGDEISTSSKLDFEDAERLEIVGYVLTPREIEKLNNPFKRELSEYVGQFKLYAGTPSYASFGHEIAASGRLAPWIDLRGINEAGIAFGNIGAPLRFVPYFSGQVPCGRLIPRSVAWKAPYMPQTSKHFSDKLSVYEYGTYRYGPREMVAIGENGKRHEIRHLYEYWDDGGIGFPPDLNFYHDASYGENPTKGNLYDFEYAGRGEDGSFGHWLGYPAVLKASKSGNLVYTIDQRIGPWTVSAEKKPRVRIVGPIRNTIYSSFSEPSDYTLLSDSGRYVAQSWEKEEGQRMPIKSEIVGIWDYPSQTSVGISAPTGADVMAINSYDDLLIRTKEGSALFFHSEVLEESILREPVSSAYREHELNISYPSDFTLKSLGRSLNDRREFVGRIHTNREGVWSSAPAIFFPYTFLHDGNLDRKLHLDAPEDRIEGDQPFLVEVSDSTFQYPPSSIELQAFVNEPEITDPWVSELETNSLKPLFLDMAEPLKWMEAHSVTGRVVLRQEDSALRFVHTALTRNDAFSYLTEPTKQKYGLMRKSTLANAHVHRITQKGVYLDRAYVEQIRRDPESAILLIEAMSESDKPLVVELHDMTSSGGVLARFEVPISAKPGPGLRVDSNRDGLIDENDPRPTADEPLRFWVNDDDDQGPAAGDNMPGQSANLADYDNTAVDSIRDLVDFFPVYLDIKQLLTVYPHSTAGVTYKLKQADGALNFVYTNKSRAQSFEHHTKILATGFGPSFIEAAAESTTQQITADGVDLAGSGPAFLDGIKNNNWGVILVEGRAATSAPLRLVVEKDGSEIAEVALPIKISPVEQMFRHVNLTAQVDEYDSYGSGSHITPPRPGLPTSTSQPADYPDSLTNGKYFVFIHGFNVDADSARGWNAEIFKRMHTMGSMARFVGVQWNGSPPSIIPGKYLDYHKAVFQAFQTGDLLAGALSFTGNADLTVAAHSLGNIVTSHAIQNGGFTPTRYYLINAAAAIEAYSLADAGGQFDRMVEDDWRGYDDAHYNGTRLYASKWHELFLSSDNRSALTWKNLFVSVRNRTLLHNFYSEQEDVVSDGDQIDDASILEIVLEGNLPAVMAGEYSWKLQEMVKGVSVLSSAAAAVLERRQGGWGFSTEWNVLEDIEPGPGTNWQSRRRPPSDTASIPSETQNGDPSLKTKPFFRRFLEPDLMSADATVASNIAGQTKVKYDVLARGMPAMSNAVAANILASLGTDSNFDMSGEAKQNGWYDATNRWRHSDFCYVALPYVYPMFKEMISLGGLDQ